VLEQQFKNIDLGKITGSTGTPIGTIDYTLDNIKLTALTLPTSNISLHAPENVNLIVTNVAAHITLSWSYREASWPHISDSGSADISVSGTSISVTLTTGEKGGHPTAVSSACSVKIGGFDISLHGGASWLYDLFIGLFSGQLKDTVTNQLQSQIPSAVNKGLGGALASLPIEETLTPYVLINYELQRPPVLASNDNFFSLDTLGEFYNTKNAVEYPAVPAALPSLATGAMAQIFVSDFTCNTAAFAFFRAGQLQVTLTDKMLPSNSFIRLNTSDFAGIIPEFAKAYPNQLFDLDIYAIQSPTGVFTGKGAFVTALGQIAVKMVPKLNTAFVLTVEVLSAGTAHFLQPKKGGLLLAGELSFLNLTLSLYNSTFGKFDVTPLNSLVQALVTSFLIPEANKVLGAGFPLPTIAGLTFQGPTIGWGDRYVYVSTDVTYVPSLAEEQMRAMGLA